MSRSEAGALIALAESIADGSQVDWEAAEAHAMPEEADVIRQLRILSNLAGLHRSMPATVDATTTFARKTAAAPAIGSWADLELIERLGGGTFGDVYRAWDRHLEREVALKLLRAERVDEDLNSSRIANEGRLLARIRHNNVVCVHGVAVHDQRVGLWMELVRGVTLEQQLGAHGPLSAREAALIGIDLCRALAAIHGAGLIHRDVKAQNVMREDGGRIVLMDLGTSREADGRLTRSVPELAGTPLYLAPEIFVGVAASARTDLYSLGVLLYHMVTGSFPVRAITVDQLQTLHAEGGVVRLRDARADLPSSFVRVVDRAIAPEPAKRYQSAGEFEAALLESLAETPPSAAVPPPEPADDRPRRWSRAAAIAGTLAAALVVAILGWPLVQDRMSGAVAPHAIRSLAVLPLVNASADSSQEYFADGITDELIGMLGTVPDINVISRTSVMQFKGSNKTASEIARALHVDAVVEGSVRFLDGGGPSGQSGKRVRLNARLMYAGSESPVWNRTFEAVASEIISLHQQLASAIVEGSRRAAARAERQPTQNVEAFDLYLKGRYAWNTRTRQGLEQSVQYFQQAITIDPNFAKAYSGLADAYTMLSNYDVVPYPDTIGRAQQAATKALELDPTLGEAHASLGVIYDDRLEWDRADAEFRRAVDLNPGYASAHHWYASHLSQRARFADAYREIDAAALLDPLSANVVGARAMFLLLERRYDDAAAESEKALQLNSVLIRPHVIIARARTMQGAFDAAAAAIDRAAALEPKNSEVLTYTACLRAATGRQADALQIASDLAGRYQTGQGAHAADIAAIYTNLGDRDRAFEWLERAREARDPWLPWLTVDPFFDPLRKDPRFPSLLASLGLTQ